MLGEILQWSGPADGVLSRWLRAHPKLGARDRGEIAEAVYQTLRHLRRYRRYAESGSGPASRRLAVLGLADTLGEGAWRSALTGAEAEWLAHVGRLDAQSLPRAVRHSLPDWLDDALGRLDEPEALMAALNQPAALDIRANPLKADRDAVLEALRAEAGQPGSRIPAGEPMPWSPWGIRLPAGTPLQRWERFLDGTVEVQDEGSQLLALLVGPKRGEMVIDFCAGAGGKTLLLGALMRSSGRLYAFDVSAARLARLTPRLARSGLSNVEPVVIANENDARVKRLAGKAQRVLVDAPCTGTGTLRRNPDIKWRQNPAALESLHALQASILASAARCVAPGGRLVYATCSLLPEENERQAEAFLAAHPGFRAVPAGEILAGRTGVPLDGPHLKLRPDRHGTDGFFAAVFERTS
ncbi:RsmB/NOP family class I SAM-dependent RNA methyltransferase [Verticiella sediminum]|uniref:RsmB/NOP family class I SAM-dependent RNA methyltransferase n=1 Tax=Verticiella sediminum TaxID=1247510 RepID=UPI001B8818BD